jgi:hypothetical protein
LKEEEKKKKEVKNKKKKQTKDGFIKNIIHFKTILNQINNFFLC